MTDCCTSGKVPRDLAASNLCASNASLSRAKICILDSDTINAQVISAVEFVGLPPIPPTPVPVFYFASTDGLQTGFGPGITDLGPNLLTPGAVPFTSGDILGDTTTDTVWTVVTPGLYEVEIVQSVTTQSPGLSQLDLLPLVNGVAAVFARAETALSSAAAVTTVTSQVFKFWNQFVAADTFAVRFSVSGVGISILSRSIRWTRIAD